MTTADTDRPRPRMIVHGGAWDMPPEVREAHRVGCIAALEAGQAVLDAGQGALAAVEAAVRVMEDDPTFDAGRGAFLNADGAVELDAGIMNGRTLDVGAVAAVRGVRNAISLARLVLESEHCLLVGEGAVRFGEAKGFARCDEASLITDAERARWETLRAESIETSAFFPTAQGTVGAVALDGAGDLAAATSTGGTPFKRPGRVGDSPIPGAGYYAENGRAAASATGWGEAFLRLLVSFRGVSETPERTAQAACDHAIGMLKRLDAGGGLIMIDGRGNIGFAHNTTAMGYAYHDDAGAIRAGPA